MTLKDNSMGSTSSLFSNQIKIAIQKNMPLSGSPLLTESDKKFPNLAKTVFFIQLWIFWNKILFNRKFIFWETFSSKLLRFCTNLKTVFLSFLAVFRSKLDFLGFYGKKWVGKDISKLFSKQHFLVEPLVFDL